MLGCYSDSCSRLRSDAPQTPTHVRAWTLLGLLPTTPLGAPCLSGLRILGTPLGRPLGCPLGHPCFNSSYKSEPAPLGPVRTSVLVRIILVSMIQILAIQLCSDIRVSLCLTSLSPCLWGPLGPLSLQVLCGSELLITV
jgi:hypothetical protein